MQKILGLDIGANSIGWVLLQIDSDGKVEILAAGVRLFPAGKEAFNSSKEKSPNVDRGNARRTRRLLTRRKLRKRAVRQILQENGLLPLGTCPLEIDRTDPLALRAKGLDENLTLLELGRAIYHINERRGFKSVRKTAVKVDESKKNVRDESADENDDSGTSPAANVAKKEDKLDILKNIQDLETKIAESGKRTLGEYLWSQRKESKDERIRTKHTRRSMYEKEFDLLWQKQSEFHSELTEELKQKLVRQIFFVRSIYWKQSSIGKCEFEKDEYRCQRADRAAQEFRFYQEMNNLNYVDRDNIEKRVVEHKDFAFVVEDAKKSKSITFDKIRKKLGIDSDIRFNLETGKKKKGKNANPEAIEYRKELKGFETDYVLSRPQYFGEKWWEIPDDEKNEIVRILIMKPLHPEAKEIEWEKDKNGKSTGRAAQMSEDDLKQYITDHWTRYITLDKKDTEDKHEKHIENLLDVADDKEMPKGYLSISRKAILQGKRDDGQGLLYFLREGKPYSKNTDRNFDDAIHGAGYKRPDEDDNRKVFTLLPKLGYKTNVEKGFLELAMINNPVVRRIVNETRLLVNAIIKEYGRPDKIHIELARDAKNSKEKRKDISDVQTANRNAREFARQQLRELGIYPSDDAILRFRLWQQQGGVCPYTSVSEKWDAERRQAIAKKKYNKEERRNEEKRKEDLERLEEDIKKRKTEQPASSAYSSRSIGFGSLFSDNIEIDHIVPRKYYTDNNIMNLVVCYREANQAKGPHTPYGWLGDGEDFEALKTRVAHFPVKKPALTKKDDPKVDDFTRRQLQDTQYASRYLVSYLRCIFKPEEFRNDEDKFDPPVLTVKGGATATLRHHWALNEFLHKSEFKSENLLLVELCENVVTNWKTTKYKTLTEYIETLDDYKGYCKNLSNPTKEGNKRYRYIQKLLDIDMGFVDEQKHGEYRDYIKKQLDYWKQNIKNRGDHRHHFIDSVVIALTDQEMLARINEWEKKRADGIKENFPLPWKTFREDVKKAVDEIGNGKTKSVSHRPKGRVRGQLHKDTNYGQNVPNNANTPEPGEFVTRKELAKLSPPMVFKIKDERVRDIVLKRLKEFGLEPDQKGKSLNIEETGKKAKVGEIREALGEMLQDLPREFVNKLSNPDWSKVPEELKELILSTLAEKGIAYSETLVNKKNDDSPKKVLKTAFTKKLYHCPKGLNFDKFNPDGIDIPEKDKPKYEINKVRIVVKSNAFVRLREEKRPDGTPNPDAHIFVETGNTHHICLFEEETLKSKGSGKNKTAVPIKKRIPVFVTQLEANKRLLYQRQLLEKKRKELRLTAKEAKQNAEFKAYRSWVLKEFPLIQKDAAKIPTEKFLDGQAHPNAKFLFSLKQNEMFIVKDGGTEKLVVFRGGHAVQGTFRFEDIRDARKEPKGIFKSGESYNDIIAKVCVDRLGVVRNTKD
ncbi:hypothetical protein FACS189419_04460 [Planctomycetales bacterium]|nr:hypothetical protein FACS189419_04460 [Planctomycetales bacterium]